MIGIQAISIYDSSGNVYQFDGSYIEATGEVFSKKPIPRSTGKVLHYDYAISFAHVDHETHSSLVDDTNIGERNWRASIAYLDGFVVWDEDTEIQVEERATSDAEAVLFPYKITMRKRGSGWKIGQAKNLLRAWQLAQGNALFADANTNNIADGFTNATFTGLAFSTGSQTVIYNSGTDKFYADITFPISGIALTNGFDFTTANANGSIHLEAIDFGGSTINSDTVALSATGFEVAQITTGADTYKVRTEVRSTGASTLVFRTPYVTLNGRGYTNS